MHQHTTPPPFSIGEILIQYENRFCCCCILKNIKISCLPSLNFFQKCYFMPPSSELMFGHVPEALSPAFIHTGTDLWPHPLSFANAEQLQQLQQQALLHHASMQHQLPVRSFLWLDKQTQDHGTGGQETLSAASASFSATSEHQSQKQYYSKNYLYCINFFKYQKKHQF